MLARVEAMAQMLLPTTDVSMILEVEDFTVYDNIFWVFQVRGFCIIDEICSTESKGRRAPATGAVPHREIHVVIRSFPSSHSCNPLHFVHSERGKVTVLPFVLFQGLVSFFSVGLRILKEIDEYWAVFRIGQY